MKAQDDVLLLLFCVYNYLELGKPAILITDKNFPRTHLRDFDIFTLTYKQIMVVPGINGSKNHSG
jgi:hypothetical protein